jgi:hypothetical protein
MKERGEASFCLDFLVATLQAGSSLKMPARHFLNAPPSSIKKKVKKK